MCPIDNKQFVLCSFSIHVIYILNSYIRFYFLKTECLYLFRVLVVDRNEELDILLILYMTLSSNGESAW